MSVPVSLQPALPDADDPLTAGLLVADIAGGPWPPGTPDPVAATMIGPRRIGADAWAAELAADPDTDAPPEPDEPIGLGVHSPLGGHGLRRGPICEVGPGPLIELDRDPDTLTVPWDRAGAVLLPVPADRLAEAVELMRGQTTAVPALGRRAIVLPEQIGDDPAGELAEAITGGIGIGVDLSWPRARVAGALALLTHNTGALMLRAADADQVVIGLGAMVAALSGFDIPAALDTPDVDRLTGLNVFAAAAVREVLHAVVVPDPAAVAVELAAAGLGRARRR